MDIQSFLNVLAWIFLALGIIRIIGVFLAFHKADPATKMKVEMGLISINVNLELLMIVVSGAWLIFA